MTSNERPPWPDDEASRRARALLDATRGAGPSSERLAEIERGLTARLGGAGTPSGGVPKVAVLVGGAAMVVAALGLFAWSPWARPDVRVPPPRAARVAVEPQKSPPATSPAAARAEAEPPDVSAPEPRPRASTHRAVAAAGPGHVSPDDEAVLVDEARAALRRGDAPRALELVRQHERTFSSGDLIEEREVVAVEALAALGAAAQAQNRARRFLARWPSSPYALRVRAVIDHGP